MTDVNLSHREFLTKEERMTCYTEYLITHKRKADELYPDATGKAPKERKKK